jgi:hypothetical protein
MKGIRIRQPVRRRCFFRKVEGIFSRQLSPGPPTGCKKIQTAVASRPSTSTGKISSVSGHSKLGNKFRRLKEKKGFAVRSNWKNFNRHLPPGYRHPGEKFKPASATSSPVHLVEISNGSGYPDTGSPGRNFKRQQLSGHRFPWKEFQTAAAIRTPVPLEEISNGSSYPDTGSPGKNFKRQQLSGHRIPWKKFQTAAAIRTPILLEEISNGSSYPDTGSPGKNFKRQQLSGHRIPWKKFQPAAATGSSICRENFQPASATWPPTPRVKFSNAIRHPATGTQGKNFNRQ